MSSRSLAVAGPARTSPNMSTAYPLTAQVQHMRRPLCSTVLFSMAKRALMLEQRGRSVEFFQGYLTIEGDYWAVYGVDQGLTPDQLEQGLGEVDFTEEESALFAERQAERQRKVEAFRQAERIRLAKQLRWRM